MFQYKTSPEGKKIVMGKEKKGKNLTYFCILAIIGFAWVFKLFDNLINNDLQ